MYRKNFELKNWCFNLFLGSTVVIMALFGLSTYSQNKIITNFPYTHFKFVKWSYSDDIERIGFNGYLLTKSTQIYQTTGMFYVGDTAVPDAGKIDFSADVSFLFRIVFGNGKSPSEQIIGEGAVLVFKTGAIPDTIIAAAHGLGYKDIDSSFAIEFDTKWSGDNNEGANFGYAYCDTSISHTAFMRNGSMAPLNGVHQLRNNFGTVRNKEICVLVEWKRNLQIGGYDLKLFTTEGNNNKPKGLILRNSMHFASLNAFLPTLSPQMPYVHFGFTAANCTHANSIYVDLIHLENGIYAMTGCPPIVINLQGAFYPSPPPPPDEQPVVPYPSFDSLYFGYDCCDNDNVFKNTITRNSCLHPRGWYVIEISGLDASAIKWWIGDSLVQEGTEPVFYDSSKYGFIVHDYRELYENLDSMVIKAVFPDGRVITFNFRLNDNERVAEIFANHFKDKDYPIAVKGNVGSMLLTDDERTQAIALPKMPGCKSGFIGGFDSTKFEAPYPEIVDDTLHFTLKEGECYADLPLRYRCFECPAEFIFKVYGFNAAVAKNASCKGAEIRYSSCNSDEVNDLVMFKIYDSNGVLVDSSIGSKSSVFTKKSRNYTYKFYNIITGKELDSGDIQINETDLDLPFSFEITDFTKEVFPNGDGTFYCYFNVKIFVSDITQFNGYNLVATANGDPVASIEPYYSLHIGNGRSFQAKFTVLCSDSDDDFKFIASVMHAEEDLYTDNLVEISVCSDTIFLSCSCKNKCDSLDIDVFFNANNLYYDKVLMPTGEKIKFAKLGLTPETNGKCFFDFPLPANYQLVEVSGFFTPDSLPPLPSNILKFTMNSPCVFLGGEGGGLGNHLVFNSRTFKFIFVDDNGDSCLIEKTFHCGCYVFKFNLFQTGTTVRVEYEMADILIPFLPLNIFLTDNTGNKLRHLLAISESSQLNGHFDIDMLELPSGIYHIVIETGNNEILGSEQFIFTK